MKKSEINSMKKEVRRTWVWVIVVMAVISILLPFIFGWIKFGHGPGPGAAPEIKRYQACTELLKANCSNSSDSIQIKDFDANRDGRSILGT